MKPGRPCKVPETYTRYVRDGSGTSDYTTKSLGANTKQLVHLLWPLVALWAPPTTRPFVARESINTSIVDLVRLNEVANFVDAVQELDPLDEFLDSVQRIGDP